jgi:hypothetical protein
MPLNEQDYLTWLNSVQASLPPEPSAAARMKRIEAEMRAPAVQLSTSGQNDRGQYSGMVGARGGPLSATGVVAPGSVMGRVAAGPVSYQQVYTGGGQKPIQKVELRGAPFDADTYFGVGAQRSPGGMDYSANVGRGGVNAGASYNPTQRALSVQGQYETKFAGGGPVHMEGGGPAEREEPRPLTIFAKGPKNAPEGERDQYAGLPSGEAYNRRFADTLAGIPQGLVDYFKNKAVAPLQSLAEDAKPYVEGFANFPSAIGSYFSRRADQPDPSQRVAEDVQNLGRGLGQMAAENPIGTAIDFTGLGGAVTAIPELRKLRGELAQAEAEGDVAKALGIKSQMSLNLASMLPVVGAIAKAGAKGSKLATEAGRAMKTEGVIEDASKIERVAEDASAAAKLEGAADEGIGMSNRFVGKAGNSSEDMSALLEQVRSTELGKLVERYQNLPAEEAHRLLTEDLRGLAKEGEVGKEWYERSSKRILEFVGGDKDAADKFAQLIAIYSPQTAVEVNTQNATKAYNRALTGEKLWDGKIVDRDMSFPTIKAANDYVRKLGGSEQGFTKIPLDDSGKRFLIAQHGDPNAYDNIATLDRDLKAHLVMNEGVPFNGRKTNNFYNNLMVQIDPARLQGSTQDLWMARAFGFLDDAIGDNKKYNYMERLTADLADEFGWKPHQIQAAIWTAMKTRQEGVKDAVKAAAVEKGLAQMVPDPKFPGKTTFTVNEGSEQAYGEMMRKAALGADVTPEAIASAARDFADFLDQNLAFVTWEATPSRKVGHMPGFEKLSPEIRAEYQMGIQQVLQDADGNDLLARYLNILSPGGFDAPGYWEGASNPQRITQVGTTRVKAAGQKPTMDSASTELMQTYAAALGLLLKQDGVGFHRPYYNPQIGKANGVEYKFGKALSSDDIIRIGRDLESKFGDAVGLIPVGNDTVRIVNFYWPSQSHGFGKVYEYRTAKGKKAFARSVDDIPTDAKVYPKLTITGEPHPEAGKRIEFSHEMGRISTDAKGKQSLQTYRDQRDFHDLVDRVISSDKINNTFDARFFGSDGDLISNTTPKQAAKDQSPGWKGNKNGEGYIQRLRAAGRSDVLEYISDFLAPRVEEFDRQFAAQHGLKRNEALEGQIRNAKDLITRKAEGGLIERPDGQVGGFAKGGAVSSAVREITNKADKAGLKVPQLAYMIRVASGMNMPPERAKEFAQQILMNDIYGLSERFKKYSNAQRTLMRVNAMIGGAAHKNTFKKGGLFQKHPTLDVAKHAAGGLLASGLGHPVMRESMQNMLRMIK